jgi:SOS-response transcriptional repressor LexA
MGTNLKALRRAVGWTQEQAAPAFGCSVRTWGAWERGETSPPPAVVELLEIKARGVATHAVSVRVEGRVRAGTAEVQFGLKLGSEDVRPKTPHEPLYAVQVVGDSMEPDILAGDVLICRKVEDNDATPGRIVVADLGSEEYVVKRFVRSRNQRALESIRDGLEPITAPFMVHGIVVEIRRKLERR